MRFAVAMAVGSVLAYQLFGVSASAQAELSWSAPIAVDQRTSPGLNAVACPSASQCTAIDGEGRQITFDPGSPSDPVPVAIDPGAGLIAISCPSVSQCTAVSGNYTASGEEVTFNPQAPRSATTGQIVPSDASEFLDGVSCPSTTQCTAVEQGLFGCTSDEVTFDPASPGTPSTVAIDQVNPCPVVGHFNPGPMLAVACPSTSQCVAVDSGGREVTFDPVSPGAPTPTTIDNGSGLNAVDCPSASECVTTDTAGREVTFDPATSGYAAPVAVDTHSLPKLACPSTSQCTALDSQGAEVTFDPTSPGSPTPVTIDTGGVDGLACPLLSQCSAVDSDGVQVTFDPTSPGTPALLTLDRGTSLVSASCPASSQCTALDSLGAEATFYPGSSRSPSHASIGNRYDNTGGLTAIACPSTSLCVAFFYEEPGTVLLFDPADPSRVSGTTVEDGYSLVGLACPSKSQCVAADSDGREVTFDPTSPGKPTPTPIESMGPAVNAVACPTLSQCTAVDSQGGEVTFDPRSPGRHTRVMIDPEGGEIGLFAIACPSVSLCTAIDDTGHEVTFDPTSPGSPSLVAIDSSQQLTGLACPTSSECVAVDDGGDALEGEPMTRGAWTIDRIAGADSLTSVSCAAVWQCVAVDVVGDAFVGTQAIPPPRLSGVRESHREWRARSDRKRIQGLPPESVGTVFSFVLSEQAQITVTFTESFPGRRVDHRCVRMTPKDRHHFRCTRTIVLGTLATNGRKGRNRVPFAGRLSPSHSLGPGRYAALIDAVNATGQRSQQHSLTFTIVR
ncbi:MAG: hypothetical protein ACLP22_03305 [Solirubrobacteraceae bacterium]